MKMLTSYECNKKRLESIAVDFCEEGTIFTPFALIEEMLDKLPEHLWKDGSLKWLDPACGRGSFLYAIKERLMKVGHDEKHIVENMLYGVDISEKNIALARVVLCGKVEYNINIVCDDSLTREWGMKFDVVVGNPPYQSDIVNLRERLWMKFVDKGFNLVNNGGHVAFITPSSWNHNDDLYARWFYSKSPIYVNIDECKKHFPGVGSSFSWYIIQNHDNMGNEVTVNTPSGETKLIFPPTPFGSHPMSGNILNKMISTHYNRLNAFTKSSHHTSKNYGKYNCDTHPDFPIPVIKSISASSINYGWGKQVDESMNGPRVIGFNMTNGWMDGNPFRVVENGQTNESFIHFPTSSIEEAKVMEQVLSSKLYKFAVKSMNSNRTIRAASLRSLPTVDLSRSWTDNELYEHFGLTQDEIKLIEGTIK